MNQLNKKLIKKIIEQKLKHGKLTEIKLMGSSMLPTFFPGEILQIEKINFNNISLDDIVVASHSNINYFVVHRIVEIDYKKQIIFLRGDNEDNVIKQKFKFSEIYAKVITKSKNNDLSKKANIVIDIPFSKPSYFNTRAFEVFQIIKSKSMCYFVDLNIQFNRKIYNDKRVNEFNEIKDINREEADNFFEYMKRRRNLLKKIYNIHFFSYQNLCHCDYKDDKEISKLLTNYKKTILYNFYLEKINEFEKKFGKENINQFNFYISVDSFEKLINATIFSLVLQEKLNIKPILIDDSSLFNSNYYAESWLKNFLKVLTISQLYGLYQNYFFNYSAIDFEQYIPNNKVASLRFMKECYYKKCLFCDRHSKENFCYTINNLYRKIKELAKCKIDKIVFIDDCLVVNKTLQLLQRLYDEGIQIKWKGTFRFEKSLNNEEIISNLSKLGCKMMFFGLESFDNEFLKKIKKGIDVEDAISILKLCKKYNIFTSVSLLFNFPGETIKSLNITKRKLKENINLFNHIEFNFFMFTKNSKLGRKDDKINYLDYTKNPSNKRMIIINDIIKFAEKKNKIYAYYLKNFLIWK